ncbi:isoleucine--tRNA ligase [Chloroflexota bacterium]
MFHTVTSQVNFPQLEKSILVVWQKNNTFLQSVEARRGNSRFVFYEGPPTANGSPGIHHALARVFKDVILRYRTMKGSYIPRIAGWDTHGLPVELEVEGKLGFTNKAQIEKYGIDRFNALCRESVLGYLKEWEAMTERIGFWVDLEHPYITMDNSYIESCWWAIKQMWDKGLIYQGYKVTPHCPRCGTSLSSHEVALGYRDDTEDPSVYIKFKLTEKSRHRLNLDKPAYFLAWTTTPWTLLSNTALAVAPEADYAVVEAGNEYLILASALLKQAGLEGYEIVERTTGNNLVGLHYESLYKIPIGYSKGDKPAYRVIEGDFVSMDEGTGIVHIAPAYGEIDFEIGEKEGLPLVHAIDLSGRVKDIPTGLTLRRRKEIFEGLAVAMSPVVTLPLTPGRGTFVKEADPLILKDLEARDLLFRQEKLRHTYPFCWRCEAPLLYYAKQTWYIRTTAVKDRLISGNQEINWYPDYIKYGRFGDWLENNVDWAFSRERYWGTPLPVWRCENPECNYLECVGSVAELKDKTGVSMFKEPLDLHRPFVDEIAFGCPKCSAKMRRVPEVIDCWFDSGAMPIAQCHYPFENKEPFDNELGQADYICEAVDQTRGWFYSLHAISTLLFSYPCFKNVICLGHILDDKGEKMSKAKGNVVEPMAVIDKYGADALRWYCLTSSPPGNVRRFSEKLVAEITRRFLLTLWNVYSFFVTYANIDHFVPDRGNTPEAPAELDQWIISELNQLILDVDGALNTYNPTDAGRKIEGFVSELSNWYVRRSRRRFWKSESDADKLSAYSTLYECLVALARLTAPFVPFLAEEIYQNLVVTAFPQAPDSVHLADFPVADETKIDKQLSTDTQLAMKVSSLGRAARSKVGIKVRQPLPYAVVSVAGSSQKPGLERVKLQVMEEINIKELKFVTDAGQMDEKKHVVNSEGDYSVAIPTEIPPELLREGLAREIVHRLQTMRRAAGFDIADHIMTCYQGDDHVRQIMEDENLAGYIKQETLSRELSCGVLEEGAFAESYRLGGHEILLSVRRLD